MPNVSMLKSESRVYKVHWQSQEDDFNYWDYFIFIKNTGTRVS